MTVSHCKVALLPDDVINQIAAGEVIENPASVVKELIENSLDAQATSIEVHLSQGGKSMIKIVDNGYGMTCEEARMALKRHATSKLRELNDLDSLVTMGFRGEALPSIASVSQFSLSSKSVEASEAFQIYFEQGVEQNLEPCSRVQGTTICVQNLFYNTPVRKKFQKSDSQDLKEVIKILNQLALANTQVAFKLIHNAQIIFNYQIIQNASLDKSLEKRVRDVLGSSFLKELVYVSHTLNGLSLTGYLAKPSVVRSTRLSQYLFINHRVIRSSWVSTCVKDAYGTRIDSQKFPVFVFFIQLPSSKVDVNVHPQKKEVRFQDKQEIQQLIQQAISKAFSSHVQMESKKAAIFFSPQKHEESFYFQKDELDDAWGTDLNELKLEHKASVSPSAKTFLGQLQNEPQAPLVKLLSQKDFWLLIQVEQPCFFSQDQEEQIHWFLFDYYGAQLRIYFEQLQNAQELSEVTSLLVPLQFDLSKQEAIILESNLEFFSSIGLDIEPFGEGSYIIQALPSWLQQKKIVALILELLSALTKERSKAAWEKIKDSYLSKIATRSMSRSRVLSQQDLDTVLKQLLTCQDACHSPKGEALFKEITP